MLYFIIISICILLYISAFNYMIKSFRKHFSDNLFFLNKININDG